jgi:UDP-3-O-[3-hydroxymyristoyl] glucosamine N-acyltransferase
MSALTVAQIAELCESRAEGDAQLLITGANTLEDAKRSDLSFVATRKAVESAASSHAGCLLVPMSFDQPGTWTLIRVPDPRAAFGRALGVLYAKKRPSPYRHPTSTIALSASVANDCLVGAYAVIGENSKIGSGCSIGSGCAIGDRVSIGENTTLHANVTIYDGTQIGSRVILHSGCVLGADGFGFSLVGERYEKFPQVGRVEIGDDVEIGANSCVDRGALGATRIGEGTKLDNLVHVAHNCIIGKHVVVAAQTGFSGSVVVGDYAVIGGQAGIGEKAKIESKAVVGGKSGVLTSQKVASGEPVWGIPARPLRQHLKGLAHVARLPVFRAELQELKEKVRRLEAEPTANSES